MGPGSSPGTGNLYFFTLRLAFFTSSRLNVIYKNFNKQRIILSTTPQIRNLLVLAGRYLTNSVPGYVIRTCWHLSTLKYIILIIPGLVSIFNSSLIVYDSLTLGNPIGIVSAPRGVNFWQPSAWLFHLIFVYEILFVISLLLLV